MPRRHPRHVDGGGLSVQRERGFSLMEVLVASAITMGVILALAAAVLGSMHATAEADEQSSLARDAIDAISDVRAMTGYDGTMLANMVGKTSTMTRPQPSGATETITLAVVRTPGNPIEAIATATDGTRTATERQVLYNEAPAPGSTVTMPPSYLQREMGN